MENTRTLHGLPYLEYFDVSGKIRVVQQLEHLVIQGTYMNEVEVYAFHHLILLGGDFHMIIPIKIKNGENK
jgi:hypothetical protein